MKSFLEFFAGVGLIREGLRSTGWTCLWANDISNDKRETYVKNFGQDDFLLGDIWDFITQPELIPDSPFLYTASFPCSDLSVAGSQAGLQGTESGALNALLEIISIKFKYNKHPKVVLLENVSGFLTSNNGKDVSSTVKVLSDLDYYVDILELDAINFSAQSRPRSFLIAVESNLAHRSMMIKGRGFGNDSWWRLFKSYPSLRSDKVGRVIRHNEGLQWGLFDVKPSFPSSMRLNDIIERDVASSLWWTDERKTHLHNQMSQRHKEQLHKMMEGQKTSYGTVYRRMRNGKSMAELRTDGFSGCLRTPKGGSSKQILIQAGGGGWKVRLLIPREYARLQGLRDSFRLPNDVTKGYFAMGDAVCVPVIEYIAEKVLNPLYYSLAEDIHKIGRHNTGSSRIRALVPLNR